MNFASTHAESGPVEAKIWQFVLFSILLYSESVYRDTNRGAQVKLNAGMQVNSCYYDPKLESSLFYFNTLLYCSNLHGLYDRPPVASRAKFEFGFVTVKST